MVVVFTGLTIMALHGVLLVLQVHGMMFQCQHRVNIKQL